MKHIILIVIVLFLSNLCHSQIVLNVRDTTNRVQLSFKSGETISFYISDKKTNDTTINTLYTGNILIITKDSLKINYLTRQNEYYYDKAKLDIFTTYDASNTYDITYTVAIKDISIIYHESVLKAVGKGMVGIGLAIFAVAPVPASFYLISGEFYSDLYIGIGGFGLGMAAIGEVFNLITKNKIYIANDKALGLENFGRVKKVKTILTADKVIAKKK